MRIPKSRMHILVNALKFAIDGASEGKVDLSLVNLEPEEIDCLCSIHDKAATCMMGDGTALDMEIYYGR